MLSAMADQDLLQFFKQLNLDPQIVWPPTPHDFYSRFKIEYLSLWSAHNDDYPEQYDALRQRFMFQYHGQYSWDDTRESFKSGDDYLASVALEPLSAVFQGMTHMIQRWHKAQGMVTYDEFAYERDRLFRSLAHQQEQNPWFGTGCHGSITGETTNLAKRIRLLKIEFGFNQAGTGLDIQLTINKLWIKFTTMDELKTYLYLQGMTR
jgi:hypothetical protein